MVLDPAEIAVDHQQMVERVVGIMRTSVDPLTLDNLAETAGLSPFYFARTFRSVAGVPPGEFQAALRFERAKRLLLTSPASVTDICFEVGYDSLGTFSSRFKRLIGIGPAQFRALPDIVAGIDIHTEVTKHLVITSSTASVEGVICAPVGLSSHVYVGLFTDPIAASRPVVGQLLPEPGAFVLPEVPPGTYYLMAAALPNAGSALEHLLPGPGILVAGTDPVVITSPHERHVRTLVMRPLGPMDPPLLTALPALLL
jgi:AraC-like DNA-binding protein